MHFVADVKRDGDKWVVEARDVRLTWSFRVTDAVAIQHWFNSMPYAAQKILVENANDIHS